MPTRNLILGVSRALLFLAVPLAVSAQRVSMPRVVSAPRASGNVTIIINNNPAPALANLPILTTNFVPVPGLGFDIPHLAATRGPAAVGVLPTGVSAVTAGVPFFAPGFFLPPPVVVVQMPPIIIQQPLIQPAPPETPEAPQAAPPKPAAVGETPKEPVRDVPAYVFVRRDGKLIFAVAYLQEKDHLEYITRDGLRRTVALDALDLNATKNFNE